MTVKFDNTAPVYRGTVGDARNATAGAAVAENANSPKARITSAANSVFEKAIETWQNTTCGQITTYAVCGLVGAVALYALFYYQNDVLDSKYK